MAATTSTTGEYLLNFLLRINEYRSLGSGQQVEAPHKISHSERLANGTAASQQDLVYAEFGYTVNGTEIFDLYAGVTSAVDTANTPNFAEVTAMAIKSYSTTPGDGVSVGGNTNPFINWVKASGDGVILAPGGLFYISSPIDGFAVTNATGDQLILNPVSGDVVIDLVIVGRSA